MVSILWTKVTPLKRPGRVVEVARASLARGVGAFVVDGRLVDGPFITRAQKLVELARRLGMPA